MGNSRIRTTIEPHVELTVDDAELVDLDRQGLIYSSESGEYGKHKWPAEESADEKATDKKKGA